MSFEDGKLSFYKELFAKFVTKATNDNFANTRKLNLLYCLACFRSKLCYEKKSDTNQSRFLNSYIFNIILSF